MIVTSECRTCILKDICINCNTRLTNIESGNDAFYVTLKCKHLHEQNTLSTFDCNKCKNKSICVINSLQHISREEVLNRNYYEVKKALSKINENAFYWSLNCKGYMPNEL